MFLVPELSLLVRYYIINNRRSSIVFNRVLRTGVGATVNEAFAYVRENEEEGAGAAFGSRGIVVLDSTVRWEDNAREFAIAEMRKTSFIRKGKNAPIVALPIAFCNEEQVESEPPVYRTIAVSIAVNGEGEKSRVSETLGSSVFDTLEDSMGFVSNTRVASSEDTVSVTIVKPPVVPEHVDGWLFFGCE